MEPTENWRPVVGYEGLYEVSDLGRVRVLPRAVTTTNRWGHTLINQRGARLMKPVYRNGYAGISLTKDGHQRIWRVNRLVLFAFIGPPPSNEATFACHKDGNPTNDVVTNLYWATPKQNTNDRVAHGTLVRSLTRNRPRPKQAKLTIEQIKEVKRLLAEGGSATVIARQYSVKVQLVRLIKYGKTWRRVA